jgi:hypothetical protein
MQQDAVAEEISNAQIDNKNNNNNNNTLFLTESNLEMSNLMINNALNVLGHNAVLVVPSVRPRLNTESNDRSAKRQNKAKNELVSNMSNLQNVSTQ